MPWWGSSVQVLYFLFSYCLPTSSPPSHVCQEIGQSYCKPSSLKVCNFWWVNCSPTLSTLIPRLSFHLKGKVFFTFHYKRSWILTALSRTCIFVFLNSAHHSTCSRYHFPILSKHLVWSQRGMIETRSFFENRVPGFSSLPSHKTLIKCITFNVYILLIIRLLFKLCSIFLSLKLYISLWTFSNLFIRERKKKKNGELHTAYICVINNHPSSLSSLKCLLHLRFLT